MKLTEFLLARIAEDEDAALRSKSSGDGTWFEDERSGDIRSDVGHAVMYDDSGRGEDRAHILRWEPARVLRECAAKRRIVEAVVELRRIAEVEDPFGNRGNWDQFDVVHDVLRALASAHSGHADYIKAWRF
jgi:hypothetical protein